MVAVNAVVAVMVGVAAIPVDETGASVGVVCARIVAVASTVG